MPNRGGLNRDWVARVDAGLCATCLHVEIVRSDRGSTFFRCRLSDIDAHFPKYPPLPVTECDGWKLDSARAEPISQPE